MRQDEKTARRRKIEVEIEKRKIQEGGKREKKVQFKQESEEAKKETHNKQQMRRFSQIDGRLASYARGVVVQR